MNTERPDKIYIQQDMINNIPLEQKEFDDDVEYIRKDALLEWAKEHQEGEYVGLYTWACYQIFIDKLESL